MTEWAVWNPSSLMECGMTLGYERFPFSSIKILCFQKKTIESNECESCLKDTSAHVSGRCKGLIWKSLSGFLKKMINLFTHVSFIYKLFAEIRAEGSFSSNLGNSRTSHWLQSTPALRALIICCQMLRDHFLWPLALGDLGKYPRRFSPLACCTLGILADMRLPNTDQSCASFPNSPLRVQSLRRSSKSGVRVRMSAGGGQPVPFGDASLQEYSRKVVGWGSLRECASPQPPQPRKAWSKNLRKALGRIYLLVIWLANLHPGRVSASSEVSADGCEPSCRLPGPSVGWWRVSLFSTISPVVLQKSRPLSVQHRPSLLEKPPNAKNWPLTWRGG